MFIIFQLILSKDTGRKASDMLAISLVELMNTTK